MAKRGEQFHSMMNIGHIYFNLFKDGKQVLQCFKKARKFADYAMTIPQNLVLFVDLLNKYLYYAENGSDIVEIDAETVDDIIELIKNQIDTIKNENTDGAKFLTDIETYFNSTIKSIQKQDV